MRRLKLLVEEKVRDELKINFKKEGICPFCGKEDYLSDEVVLDKIKQDSNPGVLSVVEYPVYICSDCSYVFKNTLRTGDYFKDGKRILFVNKDGSYFYLEDIINDNGVEESFKKIPKGEYLVLFLYESGNWMPLKLFNAEETIDPSKNLVLNVIIGSDLIVLNFDTKELIESFKDYKQDDKIDLGTNFRKFLSRKIFTL